MTNMETLLQNHANEMKELREQVSTTRKSLKQSRRDSDTHLKDLKKRYRIQPPPKPKSPPLAVRLFSFLFL